MRLIDIIRSASANMLRSKLRTALTITAIFIGAFTLALTTAIGAGVSAYIDKQLGNIGAEDVLVVRPKRDTLAGFGGPQKYDPDTAQVSGGAGFSVPVLDSADIKTIERQAGIRSVEPMFNAIPEYIEGEREKYTATLTPYIEGMNLDTAAGSLNTRSNERQVVLPLAYVEPLGFASARAAVGKTVAFGIKTPAGELEEVTAKVAAVQQTTVFGSTELTVNRTLVDSLRGVQTRGLPETAKNQYAAAVARFNPAASQEEVQRIKRGLNSKGFDSMTIEDTIGIVKQVIDAITGVLVFFAGIALLAASFGIINTLLMAVQERTKEIGLMKAMGMSGGKIFLLFSTEAVLLGLWGSFLGITAAYVVGKVVNRVASQGFLKDLPGFELMAFPPLSMLLIALVIMGVALLAGTLPARRAAKQNPIEALRYE